MNYKLSSHSLTPSIFESLFNVIPKTSSPKRFTFYFHMEPFINVKSTSLEQQRHLSTVIALVWKICPQYRFIDMEQNSSLTHSSPFLKDAYYLVVQRKELWNRAEIAWICTQSPYLLRCHASLWWRENPKTCTIYLATFISVCVNCYFSHPRFFLVNIA